MTLTIHSTDLLGTSAIAARRAASAIDAARNYKGDIHRDMNEAENLLVAALAELRVARYGVERRNPSFRAYESDQLCAAESRAIGFGLTPLVAKD